MQALFETDFRNFQTFKVVSGMVTIFELVSCKKKSFEENCRKLRIKNHFDCLKNIEIEKLL